MPHIPNTPDYLTPIIALLGGITTTGLTEAYIAYRIARKGFSLLRTIIMFAVFMLAIVLLAKAFNIDIINAVSSWIPR